MITFVMLKMHNIMKDRIAKIIREEGMTAAKFADEIGVQASGISHIVSGRNNPSTDFLIKILDRFRGINAEWLLLGKGNMYKSGSSLASETDDFAQKPRVNDLFTSANSISEPKNQLINDEFINNNPVNSFNEPIQPEKTTPLNFENTKVYEKPINDKKVEKIVIFFNDNTFESYNPNK